jgi:hypothetical protein
MCVGVCMYVLCKRACVYICNVCMYVYVCMYVCNVCNYVCGCVYVCMCKCMYVCMCLYVCNVCMYYVCVYICNVCMYVYVCMYVCVYVLCIIYVCVCIYVCVHVLFLTSAPIADSLHTKPTVYRRDINLPDWNRRLFNWSLAVSLASSRANGPAAYLTIVTAHLTIAVSRQWSNVLCSAYRPAEGMITDCIVTDGVFGCALWCLWRYCGDHCVLHSDFI